MNTRGAYIGYLNKEKEYVFCNEELETAFEKEDLQLITDKWNLGRDIEEIASEHNRDPDEIFLALFHQAREGKIFRKINSVELIKSIKSKKGISTVIEFEGRRYVYEPKNIRR